MKMRVGVGAMLLFSIAVQTGGAQVAKYVRYEHDGKAAYGKLDGDQIAELKGNFLVGAEATGKSVALADVHLLAPVEPSKVVAVGLAYKSHLGAQKAAEYPGLFAKYPTCIVGPGAEIVLPADAKNAHYEGELVVVIGKTAHKVSAADAPGYIFGVTCGNDVSERTWQQADLQWLRAKASDTFGPIGPVVATGIDYDNVHLETRVNGEVRQSEKTNDLLWTIPTLVSYISQYVTLYPGDLIFTGTPGTTRALKQGDVVEVEIEGVGVLSNPVRQEK